MSVLVESLDMGFTGDSLVRAEAISNCKDKKWSSFLCMLALSSVVNRNIISLYPDCGELKYKLLFNQQISLGCLCQLLLMTYIFYLVS